MYHSRILGGPQRSWAAEIPPLVLRSHVIIMAMNVRIQSYCDTIQCHCLIINEQPYNGVVSRITMSLSLTFVFNR